MYTRGPAGNKEVGYASYDEEGERLAIVAEVTRYCTASSRGFEGGEGPMDSVRRYHFECPLSSDVHDISDRIFGPASRYAVLKKQGLPIGRSTEAACDSSDRTSGKQAFAATFVHMSLNVGEVAVSNVVLVDVLTHRLASDLVRRYHFDIEPHIRIEPARLVRRKPRTRAGPALYDANVKSVCSTSSMSSSAK